MKNLKKFISIVMLVSFVSSLIVAPATPVGAQVLPGTAIVSTPGFQPPMLLGLKIHPENPLLFDFIVDQGQAKLSEDELKTETEKLVKYFLAALTIPDKEVWVNLSPTEKDRIIPDVLSQTVMGKTMLEQDYVLKQLASSLTNPETDLGQKYWKQAGASPTLSKVWIVPEKAEVLESNGVVLVGEKKLQVKMEDEVQGAAAFQNMILPTINKEVNESKDFADVRQIYNSVILATWYKKALKESLLGKVYADKGKVAGVETDDKEMKQRIYEQYLAAFKKGAYNLIKEEADSSTGEMIPRKYFSGGIASLAPSLTIRAASAVQVQTVLSTSSTISIVTVQGTETQERGAVQSKVVASSGVQQAKTILRKSIGSISLESFGNPVLLIVPGTAEDRPTYYTLSRDALGQINLQENDSEKIPAPLNIEIPINVYGLFRLLMSNGQIILENTSEWPITVITSNATENSSLASILANEGTASASSAVFALTTAVVAKLEEFKDYPIQSMVKGHLTKDVVSDMLTEIHRAFTYAKWTSKFNDELPVMYDARPGSSYQLQQARELIAQEIFGMQKEGNFLYFKVGKDYPSYADFLLRLQKAGYVLPSIGGIEESLAKAESVPLGEIIPVADATNIIRQFRIAKTSVPLSAVLTFAKHVGRLQIEDSRQKYSLETLRAAEKMLNDQLLAFRNLVDTKEKNSAEWAFYQRLVKQMQFALAKLKAIIIVRYNEDGETELIGNEARLKVALEWANDSKEDELISIDAADLIMLNLNSHHITEVPRVVLTTIIEAAARNSNFYQGERSKILLDAQRRLSVIEEEDAAVTVAERAGQQARVHAEMAAMEQRKEEIKARFQSEVDQADILTEGVEGRIAFKIKQWKSRFELSPEVEQLITKRETVLLLALMRRAAGEKDILRYDPRNDIDSYDEADPAKLSLLKARQFIANQVFGMLMGADGSIEYKLTPKKSATYSEFIEQLQKLYQIVKLDAQIPVLPIAASSEKVLLRLSDVKVSDPKGLHLRPSAQLLRIATRNANEFTIYFITAQGLRFNIDNIFTVLSKRIITGSKLNIEIELKEGVVRSPEIMQKAQAALKETKSVLETQYTDSSDNVASSPMGEASPEVELFRKAHDALLNRRTFTFGEFARALSQATGSDLSLPYSEKVLNVMIARGDVLSSKPAQATAYAQADVFVVASSGVGESTVQNQDGYGGINFDPTNMNLQIKRDGKGVPLPLPQQNLEQINIQGLFPVIINIIPVNPQTLPIFLGQAPQEPAKEPPGEGRPELVATAG